MCARSAKGERVGGVRRPSGVTCPKCPCTDVVEREINGAIRRLCGACGHGWYATHEELEAERARERKAGDVR